MEQFKALLLLQLMQELVLVMLFLIQCLLHRKVAGLIFTTLPTALAEME